MNALAFALGEQKSQLTLKISTYPNGNLAIKLYEKDHGTLEKSSSPFRVDTSSSVILV